MQGLLVDPWIQAQIDAAVAPYVGLLSAEQIGWMRERLAESLASEPRGRELVRAARPRVVERSGEVRCGPFQEEAEGAEPPRRRSRAG